MIGIPWWLCGSSTGTTDVFLGDTLYIHGVNFTAPAWVFLVSAQPLSAQMIPAYGVRPGLLTCTVPIKLPFGVYDVWTYCRSWAKCPQQLNVTTAAKIGMAYSNITIANPPSGGDDLAYLQGLVNHLPNDGTGGEIKLQTGQYQLSGTLNLVSGFGGSVCLTGQGSQSTIIKPLQGFVAADGLVNGASGRFSQLRYLSVDSRGFTMGANNRALRVHRLINCSLSCSPLDANMFMDGNDNGPLYMSGCNVTGRGVFANSPTSAFITNCNFYLDGYTDAGVVLWNSGYYHVTNCTAQDAPTGHNEQRGRIVVVAGNLHDVYLDGLATTNLAGNTADDNCGEQILVDGLNTGDKVQRMFVYNCRLQGNPALTTGANCGVECFIAGEDFHVDTCQVENCVAGLGLFSMPLTGSYRNITIKNCRKGIRFVGDCRGLVLEKIAASAIEHSLDVDGSGITLANCSFVDAPTGIWSQNNAGDLSLVNTTIKLGAGKFAGSKGVDPGASNVKVKLTGASISGFETGNAP